MTTKAFYTLGYLNLAMSLMLFIMQPAEWEIPVFGLVSGLLSVYWGHQIEQQEKGQDS